VRRAVAEFAAAHLDGSQVCVGLSGGPDSLALTAAAVRSGLEVTALIVDHGLQSGSSRVAAEASEAAAALGAQTRILPVSVGRRGGLEAAAREARYAALDAARDDHPVLLAHTADDQAETVLLGLARGSGARSIAGMRDWNPPWGRPFLGVRRSQTLRACTDFGLAPHHDPHNRDPRFTRVRLRAEVLPLLDDVLHGGVVEALGRTAAGLQDDNDALDEWAHRVAAGAVRADGLAVGPLREVPMAVRTRVVRRWLSGVGATEPTHRVITAVVALMAPGAGRGAQVAIGGDPATRRVVELIGNTLTVRLTAR